MVSPSFSGIDVADRRRIHAVPEGYFKLCESFGDEQPDLTNILWRQFRVLAALDVLGWRHRLKMIWIDAFCGSIAIFDALMVNVHALRNRPVFFLIMEPVRQFAHLVAASLSVFVALPGAGNGPLPYPASRIQVNDVFRAGSPLVVLRNPTAWLSGYMHKLLVSFSGYGRFFAAPAPTVAIGNVGALFSPPFAVFVWCSWYVVHAARLLAGCRAGGMLTHPRPVFTLSQLSLISGEKTSHKDGI